MSPAVRHILALDPPVRGRLFQMARTAANATQADAAELAMIHVRTLRKIERGEGPVKSGNMVAVLSVYGECGVQLALDGEHVYVGVRQ